MDQLIVSIKSNFTTLAVFVLLLAKNLTSIDPLYTDLFALLAAFIACFSAGSFFIYITGSQIATDPYYLPFTLLQLYILCWFLTLPINTWKFRYKETIKFLKVVFPLLIWVVCVQIYNGTYMLLAGNLILAVFCAFVAIGYMSDDSLTTESMVLCMTIGMSLALIGYIGSQTGISFASIDYDEGFVRSQRIGSGRGDANTAAINLSVSFFTAICYIISRRISVYYRLLFLFLVAGLFVSAILATGSRTAIFLLILVPPIIILLVYVRGFSFQFKGAIKVIVVMLLALLILTQTPIYNNIQNKYDEINSLNEEQSTAFGGNEIISGRSYMWNLHWNIIKNNMLFGVESGDRIDFGDQYGISIIAMDDNYAAAHNTVLEFMTMAGLPAGILFLLFCTIVLRRAYLYFVCTNDISLIIFGLVSLFAMLSISLPNWKTFWVWTAIAFFSCDRIRCNKV